MKEYLKRIYKSNFAYMMITYIIYLYIYLVYFTSRWTFNFADEIDEEYVRNGSNIILCSWHDKIMVFPHISRIKMHRKYHPLASPHNDGRIISNVMKLFKFRIIPGSTNKNSILAVKEIMRILRKGENVIITPDGPRGPRHKISGNLLPIAKKMNSTIIPFAAKASNYFHLNSWDKLIFPKPFGNIDVYFGKPIECNSKNILSNEELEKILNELEA